MYFTKRHVKRLGETLKLPRLSEFQGLGQRLGKRDFERLVSVSA